MSSTVDLLNDLRALARRTARQKFQESNPGCFLLGRVPRESSDAELSFVTGVHSVDEIKAKHERRKRSLPRSMKPGPFLVAVQKKQENNWMSWVSVGRAPNNDVVLRHSTISKLHARIHEQERPAAAEPSGDSGPEYWLTDVGSARGTSVNGRVLSTSEPCPLKPGDRIRFGELEAHFVDASMLYDRLRRMPRQSSATLPAVDVDPQLKFIPPDKPKTP